ncbi:MAG: alpha/beta hydrolase [Streptococcaceae bacterium]|jgi:uncharacterized alpha/beta hydrolase family protein|nr:alpha/beta hydrolase [Streptococcaceae bacterium]
MKEFLVKNGRLIFLTVLVTLILSALTGIIFLRAAHLSIKKIPAGIDDKTTQTTGTKTSTTFSLSADKPIITPTIYISGSSGKVDQVDWLIDGIKKQSSVTSTKGQIFRFSTGNNKLTVTGKVDTSDTAPMIEFAVGDPRTSDPTHYSEGIQAMMRYLRENYTIPYVNFVGYSSGATGVLNYMIDTSGNANFPRVKEFISLDGEYNTCKFGYKEQNLTHILTTAPDTKTAMYTYIEKNYQKIDPATKIILMEGHKTNAKGDLTDGTIPWGDTFSIYHLLVANKNAVSIHIYPTNVAHSQLPKQKDVQTFIKNTLYGG